MTTEPLILLVDDDTQLCALLSQFLTGEGFRAEAAFDAGAAYARLAQSPTPAAMVLDIMLPGESGLELLRRIRPQFDLPVLMLTGRGDDLDRILGLDLGADDYLAKPCNPRELAARLRALLRRPPLKRSAPDPSGLVLDPERLAARINGVPLELTGAEFKLLELFLSRPGELLSKDLLAQHALGRPLGKFDRSVDVHVSRIRHKLAAAGGPEGAIRALRGAGYQWVGGDA